MWKWSELITTGFVSWKFFFKFVHGVRWVIDIWICSEKIYWSRFFVALNYEEIWSKASIAWDNLLKNNSSSSIFGI